jgi:hypothetical protein
MINFESINTYLKFNLKANDFYFLIILLNFLNHVEFKC